LKLQIYTRYPEQLSTTLSRIGGYIGLLKIVGFGLLFFHKSRFERNFESSIKENQMIEKEHQAFRDIFTFEKLRKVIQDHDQKCTSRTDEEIEEQSY
jgi:hypothetical protein